MIAWDDIAQVVGAMEFRIVDELLSDCRLGTKVYRRSGAYSDWL
jgi:hypothetical protein